MNNINTTFRLTAVAAAMLAAYGSAFAEDDEIRQLSQPESSVSLGVGYQSDDRQQLGVFDGMRDDGLYGLFDADVVKRDEATGTWYILRAAKLGMDSRSLEAEVQKQGDIGGFISYRRIPREHPLNIGTSLGGIGHEVQVVNSVGFRKKELSIYRDLFQAGFNKNLMSGLDLKVGLKHEEKQGDRHWGYRTAGMYFLTEPIDSVTRQLDLTLEYSADRLQLAGGYSGSWFGNRTDLVTAVRGAEVTEMSVPADNQAHQFFLNGGYSFTPSTRGTIKLSHSTATQDESLPNPSAYLGARDSLDGEVVTTLMELGLTSRPTDNLSLMANLRHHDVDDRTSRTGFVNDDEARYYTPFDYTTNSAKLEAAYRLPSRFKLIAGVDYKQQDRSAPRTEDERVAPFNKDMDETTYRLQLRRSMSETLNGALTFARSERDGSGRVLPHEPVAGATVADLITPIHIADRTRDKWRLSLDWAPAERFGLQFNVEESHDDYDREDGRPFGLKSGRAGLVSLDANYQVNDDWQLTAWLSHDETRARQIGESVNTNGAGTVITSRVIREATLADKGDSVGLGVRGSLGSRLKLGADLQWTRNVSSYDEDLSRARTATEEPLQDIESKVTRFSMFATYALRKNADLRFDVVHERWRTDDWTWTFADGDTFEYNEGGNPTTVSVKPRETTNFIGARYIYKFQ